MRKGTILDRRIQWEWGDGLERKWAARPIFEDACEVRFVECQDCEGAGETATGTDWIGGVPDTRIEPCPHCDGTGRAETPVEPVECDDDLAAKEATP